MWTAADALVTLRWLRLYLSVTLVLVVTPVFFSGEGFGRYPLCGGIPVLLRAHGQTFPTGIQHRSGLQHLVRQQRWL